MKNVTLLLIPLLILFLSGCEGATTAALTLLGASSTIVEDLTKDDGGVGGGGGSGDTGDTGGGGGGGGGGDVPPTLAHSPEPGSMLLFGSGLLGAALSRSRFRGILRRRRKTIS